MSWTLALPLLLPFVGAVAALLAPRLGIRPAAIGVATAGLHLMAAVHLAFAVVEDGVLAAGMGGWAAPVGIVLVADALAAIMVAVTGLMGLTIAIYAAADIDRERAGAGWHALYLVLIGGATGAFLTGDLFNLYVWFEVMLIASFGLMVLGGTRAQIDGGVKYMALNLIATILFLAAIGMIHGIAGTLTMANLPGRLDAADASAGTGAAAFLLFGALGVKAGLFPLWFWLPAAYHTPPMAVTAIFAALLTKAGLYAMMRVGLLVFPDIPLGPVLMPIAIATMVLGVIGAAAQREVHRILSFHILSQVGYMALGLAIATPLALMGAVLYMVHNIVVKAVLFLIAGIGRRLTGSFDLARAGGLYAASPLLSVLFLLAALSMAGLPPFSGFWGKLALVQAGAEVDDWAAVAAVLGVGLFTLYSMTKIWLNGFLKPHPSRRARSLQALPGEARSLLIMPVVILVGCSLVMGLWPAPFIDAAEAAAGGLVDHTPYIT
ncbi:MAG: proton-conducting transporter membrane subunit, partial [Pseudomonadota bacterium]